MVSSLHCYSGCLTAQKFVNYGVESIHYETCASFKYIIGILANEHESSIDGLFKLALTVAKLADTYKLLYRLPFHIRARNVSSS